MSFYLHIGISKFTMYNKYVLHSIEFLLLTIRYNLLTPNPKL